MVMMNMVVVVCKKENCKTCETVLCCVVQLKQTSLGWWQSPKSQKVKTSHLISYHSHAVAGTLIEQTDSG